MLEGNPVPDNPVTDDMYDIYNNRTQTDFCKNVNENNLIRKEDLQPLLNKCKFYMEN